MNWRALIRGLGAQRRGGDPVIRGITYDSRRVAPGDCFVALRGAKADGHRHVQAALRFGAVAALVEDAAAVQQAGAGADFAAAQVADTRRALAALAARFFGHPARELALLGITGTNGKTSTAYLVESILRAAGRAPGLIGTVEMRWPGKRLRAVNTTPESLDLQRALRAMKNAGCDSAVMEVSSHGLALGRVAGCTFGCAAFTNLTQDHLDFHPSMAAYREAKALLFNRHLRHSGAAVINADSAEAGYFAAQAEARGAKLLRCSRRNDAAAEVRLQSARVNSAATELRCATPAGTVETRLPLLGEFNVENALLAIGCGAALGASAAALARGVAECPQVPGRMERIGAADAAEDAPQVVVDYAHTPDALAKALRALRGLTAGRLIAVFGCGGDRDRAKRPLMAAAAAAGCDCIIATNDNPRSEDPAQIFADMRPGFAGLPQMAPEELAGASRGYCVLPARASAICRAVEMAAPRDAVLIAGKGHEDYQIVGAEKFPFCDREHARRALQRRAP